VEILQVLVNIVIAVFCVCAVPWAIAVEKKLSSIAVTIQSFATLVNRFDKLEDRLRALEIARGDH
jgi:hypothetical protein